MKVGYVSSPSKINLILGRDSKKRAQALQSAYSIEVSEEDGQIFKCQVIKFDASTFTVESHFKIWLPTPFVT